MRRRSIVVVWCHLIRRSTFTTADYRLAKWQVDLSAQHVKVVRRCSQIADDPVDIIQLRHHELLVFRLLAAT